MTMDFVSNQLMYETAAGYVTENGEWVLSTEQMVN